MSQRNKNDNDCGPGEILRKGYTRRSYTRSDGTYVHGTDVPPTCVPDQGEPGYGPKTLPTPRKDMSLTRYGYSVHESNQRRHQALEAASNVYGPLPVLRRINLIRNYQAVPENKERMSDDVDFMSNLYARYKETHPEAGRRDSTYRSKNNSRSRKRSKSKSRNQRGGSESISEPHVSETNIKFTQQEFCENDNCYNINIVDETHNVDGRSVRYFTLGKNDVEDILRLDIEYFDSDRTKDDVLKNISKNQGKLIGIKVDDELQGYCQFQEESKSQVKITWFCANKGYGTALYIFMEKYFQLNNYHKIFLIVSLEGEYSIRRINFWYHQGFKTYETNPDGKKIYMEKSI
ncbi:putative N-acetyl transferase [Cotonvirus japonicus]|uniref:N-acetyl transferase n=1 Tax=Cotonvirus japonicus TaxID=2811091 RepID=A0ABM7NT93_9VIRU|nr:putative N-acetyl transferase [Cotonvirus japonicus]BCS83394.1 putative N-acetyl transferase [Cotonvirus japonicus]